MSLLMGKRTLVLFLVPSYLAKAHIQTVGVYRFATSQTRALNT